MLIRGPKQRVIREMPDVLAEPFFDPELYLTREGRQALRTAMAAEAKSMAEHGMPAGDYREAITYLDDMDARTSPRP